MRYGFPESAAIGLELSANVVALGNLAGFAGIVTRGALESVVSVRASKGTADVNLKALDAGYEAAVRFRDRRH